MKRIFLFCLLLIPSASFADWLYSPDSPASYYSHVSETVREDSAYINNRDTAGAIFFSTAAFSVPAGKKISGLTIVFSCKKIDVSISSMGVCVKVNGSYYLLNDSIYLVDTSWDEAEYSIITNPETGSNWTPEDLNGTGSCPLQGIGIYSDNCSGNLQSSIVYAEVNYNNSKYKSIFWLGSYPSSFHKSWDIWE